MNKQKIKDIAKEYMGGVAVKTISEKHDVSKGYIYMIMRNLKREGLKYKRTKAKIDYKAIVKELRSE